MIHTTKKRIVCIGGGTGTFVVLRGLKQYPYDLSSIVAMSDSGGSNKRIRDEFGLLPTSDIRQCFVALSEESGGVGLLRKLFMYRFEKGEGIAGMTFGNLFMAALSEILQSQKEAIQQTGKVLRIKGTVLPVSYSNTDLLAQYEDGTQVRGEHFIDEPTHDGTLRISHVTLDPVPEVNPDAVKAIEKADAVILGPGDLFTSLLPNLLVPGIAHALKNIHAPIIYVMNLMTKFGQTYNFSARDHMRVLESYIDRSITHVLINSGHLNASALDVYKKSHEIPVRFDLPQNEYFSVVASDLVHDRILEKSKSDSLVRSLIRHDSQKLAACIDVIIQNKV